MVSERVLTTGPNLKSETTWFGDKYKYFSLFSLLSDKPLSGRTTFSAIIQTISFSNLCCGLCIYFTFLCVHVRFPYIKSLGSGGFIRRVEETVKLEGFSVCFSLRVSLDWVEIGIGRVSLSSKGFLSCIECEDWWTWHFNFRSA